jgi:hypothetical protein
MTTEELKQLADLSDEVIKLKAKIIKIRSELLASSFFLSADDENLKKVREKYGKTHTIEAVKGTKVEMAKLAKNQSVCWGDGESYHFRLTAL